MWEISENLARAELTALERDEHVAEWMRLSERVSAQLEPKLSARGRVGEGRPESGLRAAARELGIDKDDARRATKVAASSTFVRLERGRVSSFSAGFLRGLLVEGLFGTDIPVVSRA
jgi:hypothetical protein